MIKICILLVCMAFFLSSCIKDDITNIEAGIIAISPEYAIPIGSYEFLVSNYVNNLPNFNPIDTAGYSKDTLLDYNDEFYLNPYKAHYSTVEPFNISGNTNNLELFKNAMFRINSVNKIPATIYIQVYFLNDSKIILDSLFDKAPIIIPAAITNDTGLVMSYGELWEQDTFLDSLEIKKLNTVQFLQISSTIEFPKPEAIFIPFDSTQTIWIQLATKVTIATALK
jgi:hypothetical protein